jgi:uridine kinase
VTTTIRRYADLGADIVAAPPGLGPVRLVVVDGPAGSGKTTFAARLVSALRGHGRTVGEIHTDDLLEGWTDMVTFWPRLRRWILEPLRRGEPARYQRYDWQRGRFDSEWHPVGVPDVVVVEGVTSMTATETFGRTLAVFVRADRELRIARGVARDGESMRAEWLRWAAAEDQHFAVHDPAGRADLVVDGAPDRPHDPEAEFVSIASRWP